LAGIVIGLARQESARTHRDRAGSSLPPDRLRTPVSFGYFFRDRLGRADAVPKGPFTRIPGLEEA
jgi:hypothetical protein